MNKNVLIKKSLLIIGLVLLSLGILTGCTNEFIAQTPVGEGGLYSSSSDVSHAGAFTQGTQKDIQ